MKTNVDANAAPWKAGWDKLVANSHSSSTYALRGPADTVYRGTGTPENYSLLYNDIAAAYANALRWKIAGTQANADKAVTILNAWSSRLKVVTGTSDKILAAGLYGYQIANAAEIMRTYTGWAAVDFAKFKTMMLTVFYPMNHDFLLNHNGACISHYWANWDLCTMASMISIGIVCDDTAKFNEAVRYYKNGAGNGAIEKAVYFIHPGNLGQWQEAGRDQGHCCLGPALMGPFCEMAWNQGVDLYGYGSNRFLAGCEYVAKYNLGDSVPYITYNNCDNVNQTVISSSSRGDTRPAWELVYNHYAHRKGMAAPNCARYAALVRPEGGGGDYGPNSGGYDQLGYGTLTFTLDSVPATVPGATARKSPSNTFLMSSGRIVHYAIPYDAVVCIRLFYMKGALGGNLVNQKQQAGQHSCMVTPGRFQTGTYIADLTAGDFHLLQKIMIVN